MPVPGPRERARARREAQEMRDEQEDSSADSGSSDASASGDGEQAPDTDPSTDGDFDDPTGMAPAPDDSSDGDSSGGSSSGSSESSGGSATGGSYTGIGAEGDWGGTDTSDDGYQDESGETTDASGSREYTGGGSSRDDVQRGDPETGVTQSELEGMDASVVGDTASDPSEEQVQNLRQTARRQAGQGEGVYLSRTPSGAVVAFAGSDAEQAAQTSTRRAVASQYEEENPGMERNEDFNVYGGGDGVRVRETQQYEEEQAAKRRRALEGIGFQQDADGNWRAPDAPGSDTLAEQEAQAQRARALEGIGFEQDEEGNWQGPDAPGRSAEAETQSINPDARTRAQMSTGQNVTSSTQVQSDQEVPGRRDEDIFSEAVGVVENTTGVDVPGEGSVVNVAAQEETDLTADLGPVSDLGDWMTNTGRSIQEDYIQPTAEATGSTIGFGIDALTTGRIDPVKAEKSLTDVGEAGAAIAGEEQLERELQQQGEEIDQRNPTVNASGKFGEGVASGGAGIANLPAIGGTVVDAGEFVVEGGARTAEGEGGEFVQKAGGQAALRGAQASQYAADNPEEFTGQVVGGIATSSGAIKGAQAVGGARAGRAASFGIQPGEEIAVTAARRGVPGTTRIANIVGDVDVRGRASELAAEERGAGQFRFESRGETEPEITAEDLNLEREPVRPAEERTDITGYERRRDQRSRYEEGGMNDGERFDASRGQTMMERRAQRRREQAEQSEVTESEASFGAESDTDFIGDAVRAEVAVTEQTLERTTQAQETMLSQMEESSVDTTADTQQTFEIGAESRTDTWTETQQEISQETETGGRTEMQTENSQEVSQELRQELGFESRAEWRREADVDLPGDNEDEAGGEIGFGTDSETFDTGVVQSLDELDSAGDSGASGSSGNNDPLNGLDDLF